MKFVDRWIVFTNNKGKQPLTLMIPTSVVILLDSELKRLLYRLLINEQPIAESPLGLSFSPFSRPSPLPSGQPMSSDDIIDDTSPQILCVFSFYLRNEPLIINNISPFIRRPISWHRYSPESAWQLDTTLGAYGPYNGTVHTTAQVNATASITFTGKSNS